LVRGFDLERAKQHGVGNGEACHRRADAGPERQDGDRRKQRRSSEQPGREPDVLQQALEPPEGPELPGVFPNDRGVAEQAARLRRRLAWIHPIVDELPLAPREMVGDLGAKVVVEAVAPDARRDPPEGVP
jgi:hypothetical protein